MLYEVITHPRRRHARRPPCARRHGSQAPDDLRGAGGHTRGTGRHVQHRLSGEPGHGAARAA